MIKMMLTGLCKKTIRENSYDYAEKVISWNVTYSLCINGDNNEQFDDWWSRCSKRRSVLVRSTTIVRGRIVYIIIDQCTEAIIDECKERGVLTFWTAIREYIQSAMGSTEKNLDGALNDRNLEGRECGEWYRRLWRQEKKPKYQMMFANGLRIDLRLTP